MGRAQRQVEPGLLDRDAEFKYNFRAQFIRIGAISRSSRKSGALLCALKSETYREIGAWPSMPCAQMGYWQSRA